MIKFFPELKNRDNLITEFYADPHHNRIDTDERLNPDFIPFKRPDFGFNDALTFD